MALALAAVVVGRGLSQALPGTAAGIDRLIAWVQLAGAHVSQLAAMLLVLLCGRLALLLLALKRGALGLRILSALATVAASGLAVVASLTQARLSPEVIGVVAVSVLGALGWAAISSLRDTERRAIGLMLLATAFSAGLHSLARFIAFTASDHADASLFNAAQLIATAGFAFEFACLTCCFLWLLTPAAPWLRAASAVVVVCAPALALAADQTDTWQRLLRDTLQQLGSHPDPWLPSWLIRSVEISALGAAAIALVARARRAELLLVAALAVLGRASLDVPLGALFLLGAALVAQLPIPGSSRTADSHTPEQS
jgi:hypothetical protein